MTLVQLRELAERAAALPPEPQPWMVADSDSAAFEETFTPELVLAMLAELEAARHNVGAEFCHRHPTSGANRECAFKEYVEARAHLDSLSELLVGDTPPLSKKTPMYEMTNRQILSAGPGWRETIYRREDGSTFSVAVPPMEDADFNRSFDEEAEARMRDSVGAATEPAKP